MVTISITHILRSFSEVQIEEIYFSKTNGALVYYREFNHEQSDGNYTQELIISKYNDEAKLNSPPLIWFGISLVIIASFHRRKNNRLNH